MAFVCKLCSREIQVGEAMVPNMKGEVAHDSCVQREVQIPKVASIPSITVAPDQKVELKIEKTGGTGFGNPTARIEPCLMPSVHLCSECKKPAVSMCPVCREYVHHGYGYNGPACSLNHEAKCAGAAKLRELEKPAPKGSNGKHAAPVPQKRKGRR